MPVEIGAFFSDIGTFFSNIWESTLRYFNWPVLIWPVALIALLISFFRQYSQAIRPRLHSVEWIAQEEAARFTLELPRGRMERGDWLPMLAVTALYALAAFTHLGYTFAPQTFWEATADEPSVTIAFAQPETLDKVVFYTGLGHGDYRLALSSDGVVWHENESKMEQPYSETFDWDQTLVSYQEPVSFVRITAEKPPLHLGEVAFLAQRGEQRQFLQDKDYLSVGAASLTDEPNTVIDFPTPLRGTYFDEIYHAYTAYQHIQNVSPYETTHPPLGKLLIALGIKAFGMTPFGWRFMGTLFGVLMIPLMYLTVKTIFRKRAVAVCGAVLLAADFMHLTQTRIATIDTYGVFFTLLLTLLTYRAITAGYRVSFRQFWPHMLGIGVAFGLAAASKWTGFYAFAGCAVLLGLYVVQRLRSAKDAQEQHDNWIFFGKALPAVFFLLILLPAAIYMLSYIPYVTAQGQALTLDNLWNEMWKNSLSMLNYHSGVTEAHSYESRWFLWILNIRPILFFAEWGVDTHECISSFLNPLICWGGLVAMWYAFLGWWRRREAIPLIIVIGYLANLVPWMLISRTQFNYHYFPSVLFLVLALCYVFSGFLERAPEKKWHVYGITAAAALLFVLFLPATAGYTVPVTYVDWVMKWLPSWPV